MMAFAIPDMTCGHCKSAIETAIRSVDPAAEIAIDLSTHTAQIRSSADAARVASAIEDAGYTVASA